MGSTKTATTPTPAAPRRAGASAARIGLLLLAGALAQPTLAVTGAPEATATVPYSVLYQPLKIARAAERYPRLPIRPRLQSHLPGVSPDAIRLVIQARGGGRPISVAADGALDFPLDDALLAENPEVGSNQPKGTLSVSVSMELALPPPHQAWRCAQILAALDDAAQLLAARPHAAAP